MSDEYLETKRKEIAECDRQIMGLLRKRLDLATAIGHYKAEHGLDVRNHSVELQVVERYRKLAEEFGMDPDHSEIICRIIMQESVANEKAVAKKERT